PTNAADQVLKLSDETIQSIMRGAIAVADAYSTEGVGSTVQHTWNYLVQSFAQQPELQDPPGSGNVDWDTVIDCSMAVASDIFVGADTVQSGLDRVGAGGSQLGTILEALPRIPADAVTGGDIAAWRSSLNPPDAGLRPDFQDGSGGQLRHGWVYLAI